MDYASSTERPVLAHAVGVLRPSRDIMPATAAPIRPCPGPCSTLAASATAMPTPNSHRVVQAPEPSGAPGRAPTRSALTLSYRIRWAHPTGQRDCPAEYQIATQLSRTSPILTVLSAP
jgi:hypothetical protein